MYKNKFRDRNNIAGLNIKKFRLMKEPRWSQNTLAVKLEVNGLAVGKNTIQKIESGEGFVTDIELKAFALVLGVSVEDLLDDSIYQTESIDNEKPAKKKVYYGNANADFGMKQIAEKED